MFSYIQKSKPIPWIQKNIKFLKWLIFIILNENFFIPETSGCSMKSYHCFECWMANMFETKGVDRFWILKIEIGEKGLQSLCQLNI